MKNRKLWVSLLAGLLALVMLLSLVVSVLPMKASAKSSSEIQNEIDALQQKQSEIQTQMEQLQSQKEANQADTTDVVTEKNNIDQQIGLLHSKISNINEQIDAYNVLIADKQEELDEAQARLKTLNEKNKSRIRAMEEDGSLSYWSVLFKANSFADLLDRLNMIEEIAAADQRRIQEMNEAAEEVAAAQQVLTEEKAALEVTKAELAESQAQLEQKRTESDELLTELVAEAERLDNQFFDYEQKTEELLAQIAAAEQEYNNAKYQEWLATSQTTTEPDPDPTENEDDDYDGGEDEGDNDSNNYPVSDGGWIIPCDYVYLSSAYGWREPPVEGASTFHSGVDLAGYEGTPIWASRGGEVTRASYDEYNGYNVVINHGDGFSSVYLHMTHYVVEVGDYVAQGQTIGYMGSTGISSGPHLHLTIYYNGSSVNPAEYIDFY